MRLTQDAVRALHLAAQGLSPPPERPATKADVLSAIQRLRVLQIDTIHVVARSPYLVLWSRLGAYEPRWLDELLAEGTLFEYWSHAACFLPIGEYGLYRRRMLEDAGASRRWLAEHPEAARLVMERVRERGGVRSAEFERTDGKGGTWWDWKPEKQALEHLFYAGELMIARRQNFQRVYDLRERVLPDWDDAAIPSREEVRRAFALGAVRALGAAPARWVSDYFRTSKKGVAALLEGLADEGALARVEVEGWTEPAYVHPEHLPLAGAAGRGGLSPERTTLLSPFDPVVWDRARALELFGFEYKIEVYTPAARRRYGYFSLPILHKGALVGRLDPKAYRKEGLFSVRSVHLEPGVPITDDLIAGLAGALRECAAWHGTPEVTVLESSPPELAGLLSAAIGSGAGVAAK